MTAKKYKKVMPYGTDKKSIPPAARTHAQLVIDYHLALREKKRLEVENAKFKKILMSKAVRAIKTEIGDEDLGGLLDKLEGVLEEKKDRITQLDEDNKTLWFVIKGHEKHETELEKVIKKKDDELLALGIEFSRYQLAHGDCIELKTKEDIKKFLRSVQPKGASRRPLVWKHKKGRK